MKLEVTKDNAKDGVRQRLSVRNSSSEWSLHPEGQQMLRRRMGESIKDTWTLKEERYHGMMTVSCPLSPGIKKLGKNYPSLKGTARDVLSGK